MNNLHRFRPRSFVWLAILLVLALLPATQIARAGETSANDFQPASQETEAFCLTCHGNPDIAPLTLPNGETLSLFISPNVLEHSIHSPQGIECEACHTEITAYPHPEIAYQSTRELSRVYYQACEKCHAANYAKAQDSVHAAAAAEHPEAPVCTDCHGAHDVQPPAEPRSRISATCASCHTETFAEYKQSVHGAALLDDENPDVPVCTDCHGVHNIQDPASELFHIESPELCAGCHANAELMEKYDLPANVYNLYQLSWHGVDVAVYKARWLGIWHDSAVCTDCHGIHDIRKTDDPASKVNPANLPATCRECHPGVSDNWADAWTGHHEISLERTPATFYVDVFYASFMPFILWLSVIYVALQILRNTVERVRRTLK